MTFSSTNREVPAGVRTAWADTRCGKANVRASMRKTGTTSGQFFGGLTERTVHLCVDMQRIFSPGEVWAAPWMERVLPVISEIATRFPERTVFTRFITPQHPA